MRAVTTTEAFAPGGQGVPGTLRWRDPARPDTVVRLLPGDWYVTDQADEHLATVLGSCIAACVRDPVAGWGGMNHFLLPGAPGGLLTADRNNLHGLRYGEEAMERLIAEIIARGGRRDRLEIKIFGGGNVVAGLGQVGHQNADFIEHYLAKASLPVAAEHLRGTLPRRIIYSPATGRVRLRVVV